MTAPGSGPLPGRATRKARELLGIDLRSLALLRVTLGILLLADLVYRSLDLSAHYTDLGVLPRSAHAALVGHEDLLWSLHLHAGSPLAVAGLFALAGLLAVALVLGYRTRAAAVLSWVLLVSLHTRNHLVNTGADTVLRLVLFWSLFLPLAARCSLDRRRNESAARGGRLVFSPASAALLLQIALIYPFTVAFKLREAPWHELTFLSQALRVEGVATPLGRWLLGFPEWLPLLTGAALLFEKWGLLLAFSPIFTGPLRTLAVLLFAGFHLLGIGGSLDLGLFEYVMAGAWLAFLPPWFWDVLLPRVRRLLRLPAKGAKGSVDPAEPAAAASGSPWRTGLVSGLVGYLFACVLLHNVYGLDRAERRAWIPEPMWRTIWGLRLDQRWALWTRPMTNRYSVFAATLEDGREVDLHRDGAPLDWSQPRRRSRNNRWWKYQINLTRPDNAGHRGYYARWLARRFEAAHPTQPRVRSVELWLLDRPWEAPEGAPLRRRLLHRYAPGGPG